jgi:hypothetical protein
MCEVQIIGKIIYQNCRICQRQEAPRRYFFDDTGQMELVWFQGQKMD